MAKSRKQIIETAIIEAGREHARLNTDYDYPVDIFSIVESKNIVLMFQPLGSLAGAYLPEQKKEGVPAGILINKNLPLSKQRYSAAHEYCHFLRNDPISLDTEEELFQLPEYKRDDKERIAETFASQFLLPRPLVLKQMKQLEISRDNITPVQVYTLALRLGTSFSATLNQLLALKIISERIFKRTQAIQPKVIKKSLGDDGLATPWNDIWEINKNDNGNMLAPKKGDILKINLDENPATGFIWKCFPYEGVDFLADVYTSNDKSIGSGGTKTFTVQLQEEINTQIDLKLLQPWVPNEVLEAFILNLQVQSKRQGVSESLLIG
ncbi:protease inhibitor I42 family protein [Peribacillus simplex]|uniref:protease inhibitor I42 family protein n=1 Tax=Peribacillus simplex TaxID=1478 RepID=UPI001925005E|nr:protease inhibitor I42 family protein [Peribacillus simplex]MBD8591211.1 protease inhibitor I42 family protein [Peribacillus simplex]